METKKIRLTGLREYLGARNISLSRFAQELGVSNFGLQIILNGKVKRPHDNTIQKMEELLNLESGSDELGIYFTEPQHDDEGLRMVYEKLKELPDRYLKAIEGLIDILIQEQHGRENYKKAKRFK
jgi:transcriptional regulator with XRE-family HTH domain